MATAKRTGTKKRKPWGTIGLIVLGVFGAGWWYFGATVTGYAAAGTGYGAKNACSCRFLAGRELSSCKADFVPGMALVMVSQDADEKSVTASIPLIHSETARYREGFGCVLQSQP